MTHERRENARKAGKASGAARRAKRTMQEYADLLLSLPVSDRRKWNKLPAPVQAVVAGEAHAGRAALTAAVPEQDVTAIAEAVTLPADSATANA